MPWIPAFPSTLPRIARDCLNGEVPVGLCDVVGIGFVRLTTRRGVFAQPLPVDAAVGLIEQWSSLSHVHALSLCERSRAQVWRWMREWALPAT